MSWLWIVLVVFASLPVTFALFMTALFFWLRWRYLHHLVRIFQVRPLFIVPRGQPVPESEDVHFPTTHGLMLQGCYLRHTARRRKGVILFGLEFGSNRWACVPYTEYLRAAGYDVFGFESRGQGDSPSQPGYEPIQWVTNHEVGDIKAALTYLRGRPDADPRGVGFFGISKGGSAGLVVAAEDPSIRCVVTDGAFATCTTMVPYMKKYFAIYNRRYLMQKLLPLWYYALFGYVGLRQIGRERGCSFPHLEWAIRKIAPRPLLMIQGGADTYIKPEMGRFLYKLAREPKEFWLVEGAKHNQALQVANGEYKRRVLEFFDKHLAAAAEAPKPSANGKHGSPTALAETA